MSIEVGQPVALGEQVPPPSKAEIDKLGRRRVKFQPRRSEEPELNLTSLIDVVLLLLIVFMLSTRFIDEGRLQLRLPEAGIEPSAVQRDAVEVEVTAQGGYRVNGRALINNSAVTLAAALGKAAGNDRATPVTIRADARATHPSVVTAMDVVGQAGYRQINIAPRSMMRSKAGSDGEMTMPPGALATYRRLIGYVRPHLRIFLVGVLGMALFAATDAGWAAFVKFFLDGTFVDKDPRMVWLVPVTLVGLFVARGIGDFLQTYCPGYVGRRIVKTLRSQIFDRYLHLPVSFFDRQASGVLLSKLTYNTEQVANATTDSITVFIRDTLTIFGLIGYLLYLNWKLTLISLVVAPLVAALIRRINTLFRRYSMRIQNSMGDVTRVAKEAIEAPRVVRVFNAQDYQAHAFDQVNEHNRRSHMKLMLTKSLSNPIVQAIAAVGLASVLYMATRGGDCIDLKDGLSEVTIRNNVCHHTQGGNAAGIGSHSPFTAEGNVIYSARGHGLAFGTYWGSGFNGVVIRRNLIFNNDKSGIYVSSDAAKPVTLTRIENNTIHGNRGAGLAVGVNRDGSITGLQVRNNIFTRNTPGIGGYGRASYVITGNDLHANQPDYGWPFRATDNPALAKQNLAFDPLFADPDDSAGLDGKFFTADDGFVPKAVAGVPTSADGEARIGCLPSLQL